MRMSASEFACKASLSVFAAVLFFEPTVNGLFLEHANFEPADPLDHGWTRETDSFR